MALSTKCLRYLTLAADIVFMACGAVGAVLQLMLSLPVLTLLPLPRWLLPPALLPLLPQLLSVVVGFLAFRITQSGNRLKLIVVTVVQVLLAVGLLGMACWQIAVCYKPRVEEDILTIMEDSKHDWSKWDTVHHQLACCGPAGPISYHRAGATTGLPPSCCQRDVEIACSKMYTQGCIGPASDQVRKMLRTGAALDGGTALLMLICAACSVFLIDAFKRQEKRRREDHLSPEDKSLRELYSTSGSEHQCLQDGRIK